jgi:hypothetical protein
MSFFTPKYILAYTLLSLSAPLIAGMCCSKPKAIEPQRSHDLYMMDKESYIPKFERAIPQLPQLEEVQAKAFLRQMAKNKMIKLRKQQTLRSIPEERHKRFQLTEIFPEERPKTAIPRSRSSQR